MLRKRFFASEIHQSQVLLAEDAGGEASLVAADLSQGSGEGNGGINPLAERNDGLVTPAETLTALEEEAKVSGLCIVAIVNSDASLAHELSRGGVRDGADLGIRADGVVEVHISLKASADDSKGSNSGTSVNGQGDLAG